jgi:hypothetical protein
VRQRTEPGGGRHADQRPPPVRAGRPAVLHAAGPAVADSRPGSGRRRLARVPPRARYRRDGRRWRPRRRVASTPTCSTRRGGRRRCWRARSASGST